MKRSQILTAMIFAAAALPAFAQTADSEVQRNINQQKRIEQGLQSGQLTTREAARLEREQAQVNRAQSHALRDGKLSDAESARIRQMQNKVSQDIRSEKHDAQTGNPDSASSRRMQADVQRNIQQQQRVKAGLKDGSLTEREAGKLERREANVAGREARAGRDGHVGAGEQHGIQRAENRASRKIHHERHDRQHRG